MFSMPLLYGFPMTQLSAQDTYSARERGRTSTVEGNITNTTFKSRRGSELVLSLMLRVRSPYIVVYNPNKINNVTLNNLSAKKTVSR